MIWAIVLTVGGAVMVVGVWRELDRMCIVHVHVGRRVALLTLYVFMLVCGWLPYFIEKGGSS